MSRRLTVLATVLAMMGPVAHAQSRRPPSPAGASAAEIGGKMTPTSGGEPVYTRGKWIEVTYGRPIKRGRDVFGSGPNYGKLANPDAPVWRAGANVSTRLNIEVPIVLGGRTIPAGEYSLFIDLQPKAWILIVSTWAAQTTYDVQNKTALFGAYDYTPDKDLVRVPMTRETLPYSFDQLSWQFLDVTDKGGQLALLWDRQIARVPFEIRR